MAITAMAASWLRARRATRVDPIVSLRYEQRARGLVEAAGVEPASGSTPTEDSTGLVRPGVSPPP